jgi:hypothetical protein
MVFEKFVIISIPGIIDDIVLYLFKFIVILENVIIETGLPFEWYTLLSSVFCYPAFEMIDNRCKLFLNVFG